MCLGIPGQIVEVLDPATCSAVVSVGGVRRGVNIAFIVDEAHSPESCLGEWVLVHVGFAMSRIDESEAARTLALLEQMGEIQAELDAMRVAGARLATAPDDPP